MSDFAGSTCDCKLLNEQNVTLALEDAGRSIQARQSVKLGTAIMANTATSHLLLTAYWGSRCIYCFSSKETFPDRSFHLSRCSKCHLATYCSRSCQMKDWSHHKLECSKLKYLWDRYPSQVLDEILLLMRQISNEKEKKKSRNMESDSIDCQISEVLYQGTKKYVTQCSTRHVASLYSQRDLSSYQKDFFYQQIIKVVSEYTHQSSETITRLLNQFHCNNFGILDELLNCIGMGVYPNIALLNHSCAPNTILRYLFTENGPVTEVVAIKDILPGEEITHSYTDCTNPRLLRQQSLFEIYRFQCSCRLCRLGSTSLEEDAPHRAVLSAIESYLEQSASLLTPLELRELLRPFQEISSAGPVFSIDRYLTQTLQAKIPWKEAEVKQRVDHLYESLYRENVSDETEEEKMIQELLRIEEEKYSRYYGSFHFELYRLRCKLLTVLILTGRLERAYRVCCQVVSYLTLALINMPYHPLLAVQLFTLGDLAASSSDSSRYQDQYYLWAYEILSKCSDEHHSLLGKLRTLLHKEEEEEENQS